MEHNKQTGKNQPMNNEKNKDGMPGHQPHQPQTGQQPQRPQPPPQKPTPKNENPPGGMGSGQRQDDN